VSRLRVAFFSVAALLSMAPWLRPPLSADIPGLHASLGLWKPIDSAGGLLLAVIALAALATLLKPSRFSPGAGVLLAAALAANAATLLNQPALIDRFHSEREQRQQIVRVLRYSPTTDPLSTPANGRVAPVDAASDDDRVWGDLVHAPDYLLFGPWLIAWAALGVWSGARSSSRAWTCLAGWIAAGVLASLVLCAPRLRAEYQWVSANRDELRGDLDAARRTMQSLVDRRTDFRAMERTWLLMGKLDYLQQRPTPAAAMFQSAQLAAVAAVAADAAAVPPDAELKRAVALIEPALSENFQGSAAGRVLAARILTQHGTALFLQSPVFTDAGFDFRELEQHLAAAHAAWQRAAELDPARFDARIYAGYAETLLDPHHPERAEFSDVLADRMLRADVLNIVADAYFASGRMAEARRRYAESLDLLNLPQRKNFRAQKGLGGI
jgi:hypothetical protein